jgi:hypothetical protein
MVTISCTEFSRQLADAVERRGSVDTVALREHAASCAECRSAWFDAMLVDQAVSQWRKPMVAGGLTERILSHVAAGIPLAPVPVESQPVTSHERELTTRPKRRMRRAGGLAFTAMALCVLATLFLVRSQEQRSPMQDQASIVRTDVPKVETVQPIVTPKARPTVEAPVELMVADAGSAYLRLAGDAAKAVTAASVLVPAADNPREELSAPKDDDRWVEDVRREIAPVTHQLGHAFEFLIQAVPEKRAPAT